MPDPLRAAAVLILAVLAASCAPADPGDTSSLRGRTTLLDPGHGGTAATDTFRVGPGGEREERVNLRVALLLRDMLEARGARVVLTRTEDVAVELQARATLAREVGADLFVSVHHNATADPGANFPIVYYHGYASQNPAGVRLARLLADHLNRKLFGDRAEVSVVSDHVIFPAAGASVLRNSYGIPGALAEASFFTNPDEEQRLRDPAYNRLEAEAYLLALEEFFSETIPPILPREDAEPLDPFEAVQEGGRMGEIALGWRGDFLEGNRLMEGPDPDLERAYELLTRSIRGFPDSHLAGEAHRLRAEILELWGKTEEAAETRRRVREFYPGA